MTGIGEKEQSLSLPFCKEGEAKASPSRFHFARQGGDFREECSMEQQPQEAS